MIRAATAATVGDRDYLRSEHAPEMDRRAVCTAPSSFQLPVIARDHP